MVSSGRRDRSRSPVRHRLPSRDEGGHRPAPRRGDSRIPRSSDAHLFEERGAEVSPIESAPNRRGNADVRTNNVSRSERRPSIDNPLYHFREDVVSSNSPNPPPSVTLFSTDPSASSHPDSSTGNLKALEDQMLEVEADLHRWIQTNDPACSSGDILKVKAYKFAKGRDLDVDISFFSEEWFKNFKKRFVEGGSHSGNAGSDNGIQGNAVEPEKDSGEIESKEKMGVTAAKSEGNVGSCSDSGVLVNSSMKKENS